MAKALPNAVIWLDGKGPAQCAIWPDGKGLPNVQYGRMVKVLLNAQQYDRMSKALLDSGVRTNQRTGPDLPDLPGPLGLPDK